MEVAYRTFENVDCFIIKIGHKFWFNAHEISTFLGYQETDEAVCFNMRPSTWEKWGDLEPHGNQTVPSYWKPSTILISECGLCRLICKSTNPEAIFFEKWMFDEVLPSLREASQYKLEKSFHEQLVVKDKELMKLRDKVLELYDKTVVKVFEEVKDL